MTKAVVAKKEISVIYEVKYQAYNNGTAKWSIRYLPFYLGAKPNRIRCSFLDESVKEWSVLIDASELNLRLGDDIIEPAFTYGRHLIQLAMVENFKGYWRYELGKVRL